MVRKAKRQNLESERINPESNTLDRKTLYKLGACVVSATMLFGVGMKLNHDRYERYDIEARRTLDKIVKHKDRRVVEVQIGKDIIFKEGVKFYSTLSKDIDLYRDDAVGKVGVGEQVVVSNYTIVVGNDGEHYVPAITENDDGTASIRYFSTNTIGQFDDKDRPLVEFNNQSIEQRVYTNKPISEEDIGITRDGVMWLSTEEQGNDELTYNLSVAKVVRE